MSSRLLQRSIEMKYIDITGLLSNRMWQWGNPYPTLRIEERHEHTEGFGDFTYTAVEGLHSLTGTYIETPAHFLGYENSYLIDEVPLEKLVDVPCVVLNITTAKKDKNGKIRVELDDLLNCANCNSIRKGDAILVSVGWGDEKWFSQEHFPMSPYFTYDAFMWLLEKEPCIIGSDTSCWEDLENPSGFFPKFYEQNILMLACLQNLAAVSKERVKLTVLPIRIENSCAAPCRAIIIEE